MVAGQRRVAGAGDGPVALEPEGVQRLVQGHADESSVGRDAAVRAAAAGVEPELGKVTLRVEVQLDLRAGPVRIDARERFLEGGAAVDRPAPAVRRPGRRPRCSRRRRGCCCSGGRRPAGCRSRRAGRTGSGRPPPGPAAAGGRRRTGGRGRRARTGRPMPASRGRSSRCSSAGGGRRRRAAKARPAEQEHLRTPGCRLRRRWAWEVAASQT